MVATSGHSDLKWDPMPEARSYCIEMASGGGTGPWTNSSVVTISQTTLTGLTSAQRLWFRVAAVGPAGQGPWSDPATKIVP